MQTGVQIAGRLLLVEDDLKFAQSLARGLREAGLATDAVHDGQSALEAVLAAGPAAYDLVILDVQLPGLDGFEVCRRLRHGRLPGPVLMLTARDGGQDRRLGSAVGADAYMVKPFALDELVARVRSLLWRRGESHCGPLVAGPLVLRSDSGTAQVSGRRLDLTGKEFLVLEYFMLHPGRLLHPSRILNRVWNSEFEGGRELVEIYVARLRRKLAEAGLPDPFRPVRRTGFRFAPPG